MFASTTFGGGGVAFGAVGWRLWRAGAGRADRAGAGRADRADRAGRGRSAFGVEGHRAVFLAVVVEQGHLVDAGVKEPPPVLA